MKLGILKEGKVPPDRRVPFSPEQCLEIRKRFPQVELTVQPSPIRCFPDSDYLNTGISMSSDLSDCDILMGVKEVPMADLMEDKTYLFFSHTIKKQSYNKKLLQEILRKRIRLIDYEVLTETNGMRVIGFGRFAGLVGSYKGLRALTIRHELPEPKPAYECHDLSEMKAEARKLQLPPLKIAVTGGGRVTHGVMEMLDEINIRKVSIGEYLATEHFDEPVYVQLEPDAYNKRKDGSAFDFGHFVKNPQEYEGNFLRFARTTDLLISAAYWDPNAPVLFTPEDMRSPDFRIKVISDITCDIKGSIPSTLRATTIDEPFYGYNPVTEQEEVAFTSPKNITVMSVDNLPTELPRDASVDFGENLINRVLPSLLEDDSEGIVQRATITENGKLTERYKYLEDWVNS